MSPSREAPLVSIVTAIYNAGDWLRPSIESLLRQTYANLEIWLVDDGSTDGCMDTLSDLRDHRIRIVRQANAGKATALNRVLECLRGEFYAIHDADDISHPRRIELQVQCMLENPEVAGVLTGYDLILGARSVAPRRRHKDPAACARDIQAFKMPSHDPTAMFRMSRVGDLRYEEGLRIGQGYDYILRVGERHPLYTLEDCLYSYRILPRSITRKDPGIRDRMVHDLLQRACVRRGIDPVYGMSGLDETLGGNRELDNNLVAHFMESVVDQRAGGHRCGALATGAQSMLLQPSDLAYYKPLACALLPNWLLARLRNRSAPRRGSGLSRAEPQSSTP